MTAKTHVYIIDRMASRLEDLFQIVVKRPAQTLVLAGILICGLASQMTNLSINLDLYAQTERDFVTTREFDDFLSRYHDAYNSYLIFVPPENRRFTDSELCRLRGWLNAEARENTQITAMNSPFSIRVGKKEDERLWYRPYLTLDCDQSAEPANLRPLLETPWRHTITDREARDVAAEVVFRETQGHTRFGRFDPAPVSDLEIKARRFAESLDPRARLFIAGPAAFQAHLKETLHKDLLLQSSVFVLIVLMFRFFLGTWRSGFLFLGMLIVDIVLVYGGMAAFNRPLDLLTNNLPLMTAIAGLEDFLFVALLMKARRCEFSEAARAMITPCFFTTLTTVFGFWSLFTSEVEMIGRFGVWAGVAAFFEWFVLFLIFPNVVIYWPSLGQWIDDKRSHSPTILARLSTWHAPRPGIGISVVAFLFGILSFPGVRIGENPTQNFPADHRATQSYQYISKSRGWENVVDIVFETPDITNPREQIEGHLKRIADHPAILGFDSPFNLADFVTLGLDSEFSSAARLDLAATPGYRRIFSARDQARGAVYLKTADLTELQNVVDHIRNICEFRFCRPVGQSVVYLEFSKKIISTLLSSLLTSCLLIALILWLLARSMNIPQSWRLIYSALWGPIVMLGLIVLFKIPVNLITSVFAATIIGLTGDNGIQYMFASDKGDLKEGMKERGEASVVLTLMLMVSSLVFLFESIRPMQTLGLLFILGFGVNLAGDLWLLKGLSVSGPESRK